MSAQDTLSRLEIEVRGLQTVAAMARSVLGDELPCDDPNRSSVHKLALHNLRVALTAIDDTMEAMPL